MQKGIVGIYQSIHPLSRVVTEAGRIDGQLRIRGPLKSIAPIAAC